MKNKKILIIVSLVWILAWFYVYYINSNSFLRSIEKTNNKYWVQLIKPLFNDAASVHTASLFQANLSNYWSKEKLDWNLLIKFKWWKSSDNIFLANINDIKDKDNYIQDLKENEEVLHVDENFTLKLQEKISYSKYNSNLKKVSILDKIPSFRKEVKVAVLDSWIDLKNNYIKDRLIINKEEKKNWKDSDWNWYIDDVYWRNFVSNSWDIQDKNWHWSHIAWIYLLNPNVKILPIKIVSDDWEWKISDLIEAFKFLQEKDLDIINVSLWSFDKSLILEDILDNFDMRETYIIAAAWNYSTSRKFYPAAYKKIYWICATDENWKKIKSSDYWDWVSYCAEWKDIVSFWLNWEFLSKTGTSQGAPVFGLFISILKSLYENLDENEFKKILNNSDNNYFEKINFINLSTINSYLSDIFLKNFNEKRFKDLDENSDISKIWAYLSYLWVINWYPDWTFKESKVVNRAEILKILLSDKDLNFDFTWFNITDEFSDISEWQWFEDFLKKAYAIWFVEWYEDWTYKPLIWIKRAEFLKLYSKAFDISPDYWYKCRFNDIKEGYWFYPYCKIIDDYNLFELEWKNSFEPLKEVTRWESAKAVYNYVKFEK